ncbi:hypothetical protein MLAC_08020 [Mycobacterium lacus]|uniref:DUF732 domain-containing protein n=1 Tax=Mycobacterium lacus TaxID=169765 RepID=A0A7I7NGF3_9MYCO|nr:hypothetical protein MLAC_08020 [Mycobacterium lacus]
MVLPGSGLAMFTNLAGALVAAVVVLTGGAILRGGTAAADPNQDEQFLALLNEKEIPAVANVPSVIAAAHKVCLKLDAGMPVGDVLDGLRNDAYNIDPVVRQYPARLTTTMTRFIAVAVQIYCPYDQPKIAAIMASFAPGSTEPAYRVAGHMHNMAVARPEPTGAGAVRLSHVIDGRVFVAGSLIGAVPAGDPLLPNPPQIPGPPPPTAQILTPPRRWRRRHQNSRRRHRNSRRHRKSPRRHRKSRPRRRRSPRRHRKR